MKLHYFFSLLFISQGFAQKGQAARADKDYNNYAYTDAITIYQQLALKGYSDEQMLQRLGNAYYFEADLSQAAKWYDSLFELYPKQQEPEYYYRYSQALKSIGKYSKANQILDKFNAIAGTDKRAQLYEKQKDYLQIIKANSGRFEIKNVNINSEFSDYGSTFVDNKLVFASARDTGGVSKNIFRWTNESFTNLYWSKLESNGELSKPELFSKKINSKFHESTAVFTNDGKTMYFTRNNYLKGKRGKDNEKITLLKIYKASLINDKWKVSELPFNSNQYSVAHPALSKDEKTLYFASDMPGSLGQSDIFSVVILPDEKYGVPKNLGKEINTEGRESFPFVGPDEKLYFASDGHPGLGGLDVFMAEINENQNFYAVQNLGAPLNSPQDDFAFLINSKNNSGFFTSNRPGGQGSDDIYSFVELHKIKTEQIISGTVTDKDTGAIISGATVNLSDTNLSMLNTTITDASGAYSFVVESGKVYSVQAGKTDYLSSEDNVSTGPVTDSKTFPLMLEKSKKQMEVGTDLAKTLNIPIMYFDLGKSDIRPESILELSKIIAVMQQYPKMKIDVRSYTDSRQTKIYNEKLSQKRVESTIAYLVGSGIKANRLTGKGYGESKLVNNCSDGVPCTELQHQANRRSEFIIVSVD